MLRIELPESFAENPNEYAATLVPEMKASAKAFGAAVYTSTKLSLREFEAGRLKIAQINGCIICQDWRSARDVAPKYTVDGVRPKMVIDNGPAPDEPFYADVELWRASSQFSMRERFVLEFAERFAEEPKVLAMDEDFWSRMGQSFSDAEVLDLAHCVTAWITLGRIAHVLGFDTVCPLPSMVNADNASVVSEELSPLLTPRTSSRAE